MKSSQGFIQGYNAQAAVDADTQVIVAQTLVNTGSDAHQMIPLLQQIRSNLQQQAKEISAVLLGTELESFSEAPHSRLCRDGSTGQGSEGRRLGAANEKAIEARWLAQPLPTPETDGRTRLWPHQKSARLPTISASRSEKSGRGMEPTMHRPQSVEAGSGSGMRKAKWKNIFCSSIRSGFVFCNSPSRTCKPTKPC